MTTTNASKLADKFNRAVETLSRTQQIKFLLKATQDEMLGIASATLSPSAEGEIYVAEKTAVIAERTGQSEKFKKFVPAEARTEEARKVLAEKAPTFAKLCA